MAKKPSSSSKRSKRPVNQSAVKGGGIMSLNKSNTSPFMKVVILVIIVAMVTLFFAGGIAGFVELFKPAPQAAKIDSATALKNQFEPRIQAYTTVLASAPTSYTLLVNLAEAHMQYAEGLQGLTSQPTTTSAIAISEQLLASRDAYKKAVAANKNAESPVLVNYAIVTYYSGDATSAVKVAEGVVKKDPTFAPAFYNLAIFYEAVNNKDFAITSFQKYLLLDPQGVNGNPTFAVAQLKSLGGSIPSTSSVTTTP